MSLIVAGEIKIESEPCVIAWDKNLFVGAEDGSIKSYNAELAPGASWTAHSVQIFALAAGGSNVYSSSNDGGVRVWSPQGEKIKEFPYSGADIGALHVFGKHLYAGDEGGNVILYENNIEKAKYNVLEEVKDLWFSEPFLFTARDLDVTVTEIKPEESKTRFITRHTMEGRAPLRITGSRLLILARGGNNLRMHDASIETKFKVLHEVKVSDMIVTSLTTINDDVWTGGWDGYIRRWKICGDKLEPAGEICLGACVNSIVANQNSVYAAVTGGKIVRIKAT